MEGQDGVLLLENSSNSLQVSNTSSLVCSKGIAGTDRYKQGFARPGAATATINYYRAFFDSETR